MKRKMRRNKYILSMLLVVFIIVAVLSLVQSDCFDKEQATKDMNTTDIPLPVGNQITKGETKTFSSAFWVFSTRYETLNWMVCNISFDTGVVVSCSPNNGILYPGDSPTAIDITVTATGDVGRYDGNISICRVGDPYDTETVEVIILVLPYSIN